MVSHFSDCLDPQLKWTFNQELVRSGLLLPLDYFEIPYLILTMTVWPPIAGANIIMTHQSHSSGKLKAYYDLGIFRLQPQ